MANDLVRDILSALNREVLNALDLAGAITHPGESGRAREQILATYFRKVLPASFGISTGFVFDAAGSISKQIDIIIYRDDYHPIFEIGGIKHFMVESVAAVLEIKASIASKEVLRAALENIKSVKALDRANRNRNYIVVASQHGAPVDPNRFQHQIFGAIVTERSLSRGVLQQELHSFLSATPNRNHWPNFYADVRTLSATYMKTVAPPEVTAVPQSAQYLAFTDNAAPNFVPPLIELTFELVNFLRVAPTIDYKPTDYLSAGSGKVDWLKL